jgi:predicted Rossmann-fold nucleotide-binding protein
MVVSSGSPHSCVGAVGTQTSLDLVKIGSDCELGPESLQLKLVLTGGRCGVMEQVFQ